MPKSLSNYKLKLFNIRKNNPPPRCIFNYCLLQCPKNNLHTRKSVIGCKWKNCHLYGNRYENARNDPIDWNAMGMSDKDFLKFEHTVLDRN